jgi:Protein kinase domain
MNPPVPFASAEDSSGPAPQPAGVPAETMTFAPPGDNPAEPSRIGKYQEVRRFSQSSGQAAAYLAFDPDLNRHVVLKRYHGQPGEETGEAEEGRALARVHSTYVAGCLGVDRIGDEPYLVVEYIPGRNLTEIRSDEPLERARAIGVVTQLAEGVAAVHACGLIHRDIKPANVVLHDDGTPRLVDFGLAAHLGSSRLRRICGTPAYMSPEQARWEWDRIDQRSDVFALGAILYFLLVGRAPYTGNTFGEILAAARKAVIEPPRGLDSTITESIEVVCLKALAPAPENRYLSAQEFRQALVQAAEESEVRRPASRAATLRRRAAIAVAFVIATLALIVWFHPGSSSTSGALAGGPLKAELSVIHYEERGDGRFVRRLGEITAASLEQQPARLYDSVRIRVTLSRPAYYYLISLNPDGTDQLFVRKVPSHPEALRRVFEFPEDPMYKCVLTEGVGLQAFVLIASDLPLPEYETWKSQVPGGVAWTALDKEGLWTYDSGEVAASREVGRVLGESLHRDDAPAPLIVLCDRFVRQPGVVLVHAVAFPVKPPRAVIK